MSALSHNVTSKFGGFFKSLFGKGSAAGASDATATEEAHVPVTIASSKGRPVSTPVQHYSHPKNGNGHASHDRDDFKFSHSLGNGQAHNHVGNENEGQTVPISLQAIVCAMPPELRGRVRQAVSEDLTVPVSLDRILSQLSHGAVKIPFGDIRKAVPHVFAPPPDADQLLVTLPLGEILPHLSPNMLLRRPTQKAAPISDDITSPFALGGQGLTISNDKPRAATPPPAAPPVAPQRPVPPPPVVKAAPPVSVPPPIQRIQPTAPPVPRQSIRAVPTPPPPSVPPVIFKRPAPPAAAVPPAPAPAAPITPVAPAAPKPPVSYTPVPAAPAPVAPIAKTPVAPTPPPPVAAMPAPAPVPVAAPAPAPVNDVPPLILPLASLAAAWPDAVKQEIVRLSLGDSQVALPMELIEAGLKRGRISFPWKTLQSWLRPTPPSTASANESVELELPLSMIAPLFISRRKSAAAPKSPQKIAVDDSIPNLFFGFPQPEAPAPAPVAEAPMAFVAPVAPEPAPTAEPVVTAAKPTETNYFMPEDGMGTAPTAEEFRRPVENATDFTSRKASPDEVIRRAAALEGVVGAIIALPDGLKVAASIPAEHNGDTLSAFLPQLFNKMGQCTRELRMGELNNLNFTVGNVPWKIFRVNAVYFAVFGRAGQPLPTAQLAALAGELDRKNKQ